MLCCILFFFFFFFFFIFFFNDTATTEIYTLSLHDALPISLKFTSTGAGGGDALSPYFEVTPADLLEVVFALYSTVVDVRNVVDIIFYDKDKVSISTTNLYDDSTANPTSWAQKLPTVTPPATARYAKVQVYGCHSSDPTAGSTWFDSIIVRQSLIKNVLTTAGDIVQSSATNVAARLPIGNPGQIPAANAGSTALVYWAPKGHLYGLIMSNDTDTDHDINITSGEATDSTDASVMKLTSEMTKRIDAAWAVGDDAGGLDGTESSAGTPDASTWYHCYLIMKDSDGSVDALFSENVSAPTMPTGYTKYRRIGAVLTDGSANITRFKAIGNGGRKYFQWRTSSTDFNDITTTATLRTARVPLGLQIEAQIHYTSVDNDVESHGYAYGPDQAGTAPNTSNNMGAAGTANSRGNATRMIITNTSSQYYTRHNISPTNVAGSTIGYYEDL